MGKSNGRKKYSGMITLEALIALMVITFSLSTVLLIVFGSEQSAFSAHQNEKALYITKKTTDVIIAELNKNFEQETFEIGNSNDMYQKSINIDNTSELTKKIEVTTRWNNNKNSLSLVSLVTNRDSEELCHSFIHPRESWKNVNVIKTIKLNNILPNEHPNTSLKITDLKIKDEYLYITTDSKNTLDHTFFIFQYPENFDEDPIYISSIDNALSIGSAGLGNFSLSKDYVYAVNTYNSSPSSCIANSNCAQLQIIKH
jgi:Tfp pilus assembly protein PilV